MITSQMQENIYKDFWNPGRVGVGGGVELNLYRSQLMSNKPVFVERLDRPSRLGQ